jgi:hypothetical protein
MTQKLFFLGLIKNVKIFEIKISQNIFWLKKRATKIEKQIFYKKKTMETFETRLLSERKELKTRFSKLGKALENQEKTASMCPIQLALLGKQYSAMKEYLNILNKRIAMLMLDKSDDFIDEVMSHLGVEDEGSDSSESKKPFKKTVQKEEDLGSENDQ